MKISKKSVHKNHDFWNIARAESEATFLCIYTSQIVYTCFLGCVTTIYSHFNRFLWNLKSFRIFCSIFAAKIPRIADFQPLRAGMHCESDSTNKTRDIFCYFVFRMFLSPFAAISDVFQCHHRFSAFMELIFCNFDMRVTLKKNIHKSHKCWYLPTVTWNHCDTSIAAVCKHFVELLQVF